MNLKKLLISALLLGAIIPSTQAQFNLFGKKKNKVTKQEKKNSYKSVLKGFKTEKGIINLHSKDNILYFELKNDLMGKDILMSSRMSALSNNESVSAGQMLRPPLLVRYSKDDKNVYLHTVVVDKVCCKDSPSYASFSRNHLSPIVASFPIKTFSKDSSSVVIDVTKFFTSNHKAVSPFGSIRQYNRANGKFFKERSKILKAKTFPRNVNVRSRLAFSINEEDVLMEMTRSFILLPEEPMKIRYADPRVGVFSERRTIFNENKDDVQVVQYANRWRLEPKPEDLAKYKNGELVVPAKPIVWYVDTAIPTKLRKYILEGIEDWQIAFEKIGFKDAIVAREYPTKEENPDFDPDDIRYSCYRYVTTSEANSMGPSWVDPRTGEILTGDVLYYSNVTKILNNWRFVQTAQLDSRVRCETLPTDIMGESLRYVAAHEVGHTLGFMHNMGASHAYPLEKLRDPEFTKEYGTTPSIMDYARNNYVAQPEDKGVKLTPPNLGLYDIYSIAWLYTPIFDAETPEEEYPTLNKWIMDKVDNPIYTFGGQQWPFYIVDPTSQSEDLGDCAIGAAKYGVKNLKYIMNNIMDWTTTEGKNYDRLHAIYGSLNNQLNRYFGHVYGYIGGYVLKNAVKGDNLSAAVPVSKDKQVEALDFMFGTIRSLPNWLEDRDVLNTYEMGFNPASSFTEKYIEKLASGRIPMRLSINEASNPKAKFTSLDYMDLVYDKVFEKVGNNLNYSERLIQYTYVRTLLVTAKYLKAPPKRFPFLFKEESLCSRNCIDRNHNLISAKHGEDRFAPFNANYLYELNKVKSLCKSNLNKGNKETRIHYKNIYEQLVKLLDK